MYIEYSGPTILPVSSNGEYILYPIGSGWRVGYVHTGSVIVLLSSSPSCSTPCKAENTLRQLSFNFYPTLSHRPSRSLQINEDSVTSPTRPRGETKHSLGSSEYVHIYNNIGPTIYQGWAPGDDAASRHLEVLHVRTWRSLRTGGQTPFFGYVQQIALGGGSTHKMSCMGRNSVTRRCSVGTGAGSSKVYISVIVKCVQEYIDRSCMC